MVGLARAYNRYSLCYLSSFFFLCSHDENTVGLAAGPVYLVGQGVSCSRHLVGSRIPSYLQDCLDKPGQAGYQDGVSPQTAP